MFFRFFNRRTSSPPDSPPHPVDAVPRLRLFLPLGLQHVIVAYTGMATVPLIIGLGIGLNSAQIATLVSANVLVGGAATLLQTLGILNIGVRLPIVMGSTFTGITPAIIVGQEGGLPAVFGATIVVGLLTWIVAPYFSQILRFFPPIVTGTTIAIIGFSLLPTTSTLIAGSDPDAADYGSMERLLLAFGTVVLFLAIERFAGAVLSRFAIIIAIVLGTLIAYPFGWVDFSQVGETPWFGVVQPFEFGLPTFTIAAILPMLIVQLVNMIESTGDTVATGQVVGREVGPNEVARSLRADGVSTAFAGVFNTFPFVTFSANVGLVGLTRVMSRYIVATAGLLMITIGFMPKFGAVVASLPEPVLGGISLVMFGVVGAIGAKILARADLSRPRNHLIIAISFGVALLPIGSDGIYDDLPQIVQTVLYSGIAAGGITSFVLNLVLNGIPRKDDEPEDSAAADGAAAENSAAEDRAATDSAAADGAAGNSATADSAAKGGDAGDGGAPDAPHAPGATEDGGTTPRN